MPRLNGGTSQSKSLSQRSRLPPVEAVVDARRSEDIWQYLYKGEYWRRGLSTMSANLRGRYCAPGHKSKKSERPALSRLLGRRNRATRVPRVRTRQWNELEETVDAVGKYNNAADSRPSGAIRNTPECKHVRQSVRKICITKPAESLMPPRKTCGQQSAI